MNTRLLLLGATAIPLLLFTATSPALAQVGTPNASNNRASAASAPTNLSEVVVTAQKREQRLQDVPVVVTVLNTQKLEANQVRSVSDLVTLTPGLTSTTNGTEGTTIARIRGVGNVADNPGLEDAVGLYIDGVYRPRNGVSFNDLGNLSDIEVLKGPQGTLFGKNTIAGVIQITTKRPSFTFGAEGEATFQNYGGYGGSASVTGPLSDKVAMRLYVADRERDGFIPVKSFPSFPGGPIPNIRPQNDEHVFTTRDQVLFKPSDDFDVNIIGDYTRRRDHCCVAVDYLNGAPATVQNLVFPGTIQNPISPDNRTAYLNQSTVNNITDWGFSANASWRTPWFNNAELTSITAYRDNLEEYGGDTDGTGAGLVYTDPKANFTRFRQFSEELQYRGTTDWMNWQVGFFFSHEMLDSGIFVQNGPELGAYLHVLTANFLPAAGYPPNQGAIENFHQKERSEALYTQEDFRVTDAFHVIVGLRYTWEHKDLNSVFSSNDTAGLCARTLALLNGGAPVPFANYRLFSKSGLAGALGIACLNDPAFAGLNTNQTLDEGALTGTVKLQYKFSDTRMVYASYSKGNLVGGFNLAEVTLPNATGAPNTSLAPQTNTAFPAEWVDAYEIGSKTQWLDRTLSLNAAAFYQVYRNHQLNAFTGTQFVETTIPRAIAEGAELEAYYQPVRNLVLNAGVTYADTYYPNNAQNIAALGATDLFRLPGSRLTYAPLWSLTVGASYKHPVTDRFDVFGGVDAKYSSDYSIGSDEDPAKFQPAFWLANARIGLTTHDERYSIQVWATNIFNKNYKQTAFDGVIQTFSAPHPSSNAAENNYYYYPGQPRFVGVTVRAKY